METTFSPRLKTGALTILFWICAASTLALEKVETFYPGGTIRERYYVTKTNKGGSLRDSTYAEFYRNGKKKRVLFYRKNNETGTAFSWYESGDRESECYYENGELCGVKTVWYQNGALKSRDTWQQGVLNGKSESWFAGGRIRSQGTYVNGKAHDEYRTWYENGRMRSLVVFKNGTLYGAVKGWHNNGELAISGFYNENGQPDLKWQIYRNDGKKCAQIEYREGQEIKKRYFVPDSVIDRVFETISTPK